MGARRATERRARRATPTRRRKLGQARKQPPWSTRESGAVALTSRFSSLSVGAPSQHSITTVSRARKLKRLGRSSACLDEERGVSHEEVVWAASSSGRLVPAVTLASSEA